MTFVMFQIISLRSGYRSVPLKNGYSEDIPLASLLVHITIRSNTVSKEKLKYWLKKTVSTKDFFFMWFY